MGKEEGKKGMGKREGKRGIRHGEEKNEEEARKVGNKA